MYDFFLSIKLAAADFLQVIRLGNIKENVAYGTSLRELIQTEDNEVYIKTEQIQFEANQAYGILLDHEQIQIHCDQDYKSN